jgi:hypothetical protein
MPVCPTVACVDVLLCTYFLLLADNASSNNKLKVYQQLSRQPGTNLVGPLAVFLSFW